MPFVFLAFGLLAPPVRAANECACLPCDFDQDGDVDQADFGHLQLCLTGTGIVQSDPACLDARLAGHSYIDQQDVTLFRTCLSGEQKPYQGSDLPEAVISEFLASNDGGLADEDGDQPDWIEIYVPCRPTLNLGGWFLTDDPDNLRKWEFPSLSLVRGDRVVVFASGKDRRVAGHALHTNFQLEKDGEYLALVAPDGQTVIHGYAPQFPAQLTNVSYGLSGTDMQPRYFTSPTPGAANGAGALGFVLPVAFDQQRGFRSAAFQLALSCPTPDVQIRYTLDGAAPTSATGLVYSQPVAINGTRVVRAAGFKTDYLPSAVATHTYLFASDIIHQSPQGQAPGSAWPAPGTLNGQIINYGMDPDVINDARYTNLIDDALLAVPSISLVTDLPNLFSTSTGIYTHAAEDTEQWERPCSVELINPDGRPGFQIDAGLRIRGGWSRSGDCPKHGFRLFFRSEYGQKELQYPLFEDEGVSTFRKIDLRTEQDYSWSFVGDSRNTFVREVFSRDTEAALGDPYTRSRYYHLYIDGQYWGLYQTEERAEADYAASYFGGAADNYDVIKVEAGVYTIYATDGNTDAWYRLWQACQAGFTSDAAYYKVQGLNPDGTRNPDYEVLVDVDNTIDNALITYYIGDIDGPTSEVLGNGVPNNFFVLRDRTGQSGFKCFKHDAEMAMLDVNENRIGPWAAGQQFQHSNPQYLSECLMNNAEYRMRFADRVQKFMFNGGPLTPASAAARFTARANQVQTAIIAESARWGDAKIHPPRNRDDDWAPAINWVVSSYIPVRTGIVIDQLKAKNLYPSVSAPLFSSYGGLVPAGFVLSLSKPSGAAGTIYGATDGTDPRLRGGAVASGAGVLSTVIIDRNMTVKARIKNGNQWSALVEAVFVTQPVGLLINEFMADNKTTVQDPDEPGEYPDWIEIYNPNPAPVSMGGMYLTDDFNEPTKFQIAAGVTIPANDYLVFWADSEPAQGSLHTTFALSKGGERIGLYAANGTTVIDQIIFGTQTTDVSYGRYPDGGGTWGQMAVATPGRANGVLR